MKNKNTIIYGAGGAIGSAVAQAFSLAGARVFLAGRSIGSLTATAKLIEASGGIADIAIVDATNGQSVNRHFSSVLEKAGKVDISFNAIGIPQTGVQGIPLMELTAAQLLLPVDTYLQANFLTAQAAGRHMLINKKGVIMMVTSIPAKIASPMVGGMAPSWAAMEALNRTLATELGSFGVRVVTLRSDGMPDSDTITEVFGIHAKGAGMPSHKDFEGLMSSMTLLKRLPNLNELANTAVFIASDQASAITGTVINLSCGSVVD